MLERAVPAGARARWNGGLAAVFLVVAVLLAGLGGAQAQSSDVYAVGGVDIDTTGADDLAAKRAGVAEAKRRAFETLIDRLTLDAQAASVAVPDPDRLEFLIRDVTFDEEKFGGGRYLAELTVRFQPDAIRQFMRREGIAFAEIQSRPLVVVPVLQRPGAAPVLWFGGNEWLEAWMARRVPRGLVPVLSPLGDLEDIAAIDAQTALAGDATALKGFADRYQAGGVVVAHAQPDASGERMSVAVNVQAPGWSPVSTVVAFQAPAAASGADAAENAPAESSDGAGPGDREDAPSIHERAVEGVIGLLEEAWTRENLIRHDATATVIAMRAPLGKLGDLVAVRRALDSAPPVRAVALERLTTGEADLEVEFVGDIYQLQTALLQAGLTLDLSEDASAWLLRRKAAAQ